MAKGPAWEAPAREVPARGGGEALRPPVEGVSGTGARGPRPARGGQGPEAPAHEVPVPDEAPAPGIPAREYGPDSPRQGYGPEDFPGCESFHLPERALEYWEGRLEFWDGLTETAWKVSEPPSLQHEGPSRRLVRIAERMAMLRGSRILCLGASGLVRRDAAGRKRWLMQADEVLYLHPERVRLAGTRIDVEADPLPDVVLEVDHSTDVRKGKLGIYKEGGFPEIWVLVPWESSRRAPGLAVHVRGDAGYREAAASRAFPGWKAEEIFRALTEEPWTEGARRALERVARAMGAREGTRPEDDPTMRSVSLKAREEGRAEGDAKGYERGRGEGRDEGRRETLAASVRAVLAGRGIEAALDSVEDRALIGALPAEVLIAAALACTGEADFRRRARAARAVPELSP